MQATHDQIRRDSTTLDHGYQTSHAAVKKFYRDYQWMVGNLPRDQRLSLDTLLHYGLRVSQLLDLESTDGSPLKVWNDFLKNQTDAMEDNYASVELVALVDTIRKYQVPESLLFDSLSAAEKWIHQRKFETFDELASFAGEFGGSLLTAVVPVLGFIKPGYEKAANECGKAILLTQLLAHCAEDAKRNKVFVAQQDLEECEIVVEQLKLRQTGKPLKHLVRLYCWRIEKILLEGGKLALFLDYDGRRSLTSLLATHWRMLMQMKLEPESVMNEDGVLSRRDWFGLKSRHLLGLEGNVPVIPTEEQQHH